MKYYRGKTLYELLEDLKLKTQNTNNGSAVVKFVDNSSGRRIYFVENNGINYKVGDSLTNVYTNEYSKIKKNNHNKKIFQ